MDHELITFDEVGFRLVPVYRRVWFFKGEKPRGVFFWSNKKLNLIGALINGTKIFYEWHNSLNSLTFKAFLSDFIDTLLPEKNYVFLLDNVGYHKTSCILNFLKRFQNIKVEFYPTYSPELRADLNELASLGFLVSISIAIAGIVLISDRASLPDSSAIFENS